MSAHNQPPAQAVVDLPVAATVVGAFASVAGQLGLVARAAKGAIALLVAASLLSLVLPAGGGSSLFLILVSFAATAHFGLNWCRVMLLGPAGLPARSLGWREPHWRFFGYGLLLFLVMLLSSLPMTAIASVIAGILGLAASPGEAGPRLGFVLLLVFIGMIYVLARLGFIFPAVAVEERYSLRLAWQHTAGQGQRMMAALFAAGFPIAIAQLLLTALLLESLFGVSLSELVPALPEPGAAPPGAGQPDPALPDAAGATQAEAPSVAAILVFDLVAAVGNLLSFAVLFSLLSIAFRTCTGWVPAAPDNLPARTEEEGPGSGS
jgi:hypothetical protein